MSAADIIESALTPITYHDALSIVYYAQRLLRHRQIINDIYVGRKVPGLPSEPTPEQQAAAVRLIEAIQDTEHLPLHELNQEQADHYSLLMSGIMSAKRNVEFNLNPERGEILLEKLRRTPSYHPAADAYYK